MFEKLKAKWRLLNTRWEWEKKRQIDKRGEFNIGGLIAVIIAVGIGVIFVPTVQTAVNSMVSGSGHPLNGSAATLASNFTVIYAIALVMGVVGYIVYASRSL